jgi:hypothetical protein
VTAAFRRRIASRGRQAEASMPRVHGSGTLITDEIHVLLFGIDDE